MKLTDEQEEIKDAVAHLSKDENLKVIAFAGAGKTTTLKACALARKDRGVYLAFNKATADEAKIKLGRTNCTSMTMHSLASRAMRQLMKNGSVENLNTNTFKHSETMQNFPSLPQIKSWGSYRIAAAVMRTIANFSASADTEISLEHAKDALIQSVGDPEILNKMGSNHAAIANEVLSKYMMPICRMARQYWKECIDNGEYSHDMYLKKLDLDQNILRDAFRRFRYVMIDEAQDINPVQRSILSKSGLPIIAVGDPYQQIYSWRGAENALNHFPGKELYLTQSFRFGENIAEQARQVLATIPSGGPKQRLIGAGPNDSSHVPQNAILCRTNIGMIDEAIHLDQSGQKFFVDNIHSLVQDAKSAQALYEGRKHDVESRDLKQFNSWDELVFTADEGGDPHLAKLVTLVRSNRIKDVIKLQNAQDDEPSPDATMIYTGHRSKGMEFGHVKLGQDWPDLDDMKKSYKKAVEKSQKDVTMAQESWNLLYVGVTRGIHKTTGLEKIMQKSPKHDQRDPNIFI